MPGESQAHPRLHALCRFVARPAETGSLIDPTRFRDVPNLAPEPSRLDPLARSARRGSTPDTTRERSCIPCVTRVVVDRRDGRGPKGRRERRFLGNGRARFRSSKDGIRQDDGRLQGDEEGQFDVQARRG